MLKMLYADLHRVFCDKRLFPALPFLVIFYVLFEALALLAISAAVHMNPGTADDQISAAVKFVPILLSFVIGLHFGTEYTDGCIRNKLIIGTKRSSILISGVCVAAFLGVIIILCAELPVILCGYTLFDGFVVTPVQILETTLIYMAAAVSLSVFFTVLVFVFGNNRAAWISGPAVSTIFFVLSLIVLDKLYPDSGVCTLSGARLEIYTFLDHYVPFFHLIGYPRWELDGYIIGNAVLVIVSLVAVLVLFAKKDIN